MHVVSASALVTNLKYINIRGIFEDPTALADFCNCENEPCWSPYDIYPLNMWMWEYMKDVIIQRLLQKKTIGLDDSNDAKDDSINDRK